MSYRSWLSGDPVPMFKVRSSANPRFSFDSVAGRYIVLSFFGTAGLSKNKQALDFMTGYKAFFNGQRAGFFGVSIDAEDESTPRVTHDLPGVRYFWDFDRSISILYGAARAEEAVGPVTYKPFTLILDPMLRVLASIPLSDVDEHNATFARVIANLPAVADYAETKLTAPVLIVPRVFEPEFCQELIGQYNAQGGRDSGFMREIDGKTVPVLDHFFKRRKDFVFDEEPEYADLRAAIRDRLKRRLIPEIAKAFQFQVTRIERYIVACYEGETRGFFYPHRDNTTKGTAHRRFACTLNLNATEYEGGELRFPEFGPDTYRAPTGGAAVFSCSLLHEATPVTRGTRYTFLPFLYDEAAAKIREENLGFLSHELIDRT